MRRGRRAGVTLVELLFAAAILGGGLLLVIGLVQGGFRFAAELGGRERANAIAGNLLQRYQGLSLDELGQLLGTEEVDPGATGDRFLEEMGGLGIEDLARLGHARRVKVRRVPGALEGVGLSGTVTFRRIGGGLDERRFGIYWVPPRMREIQAAKEKAKELPEWGRARAWRPGAETFEAKPLERVRRLRGTRLPQVSAGAAAAALAASLAPAPAPGRLRPRGDAAAWERLAGPRGAMARRATPTSTGRRAREARREDELASRTGLLAEEGRDPIPDGRYPYVLDVLELPGREDAPELRGVLVLDVGGEERALPARRRVVEGTTRESWAREDALESRILSDGLGRRVALRRTLDRVYLVELDGPLLERRIELRTLPSFDLTPEGTAATRRFLAELLGRLELVPHPGTGGNPLEEAHRSLRQVP